MPVNTEQLAPFLVAAKRRFYAAQGDEAGVYELVYAGGFLR